MAKFGGEVQGDLNESVFEALTDKVVRSKSTQKESSAGDVESSISSAFDSMAEGVVLAAAWFTVRMVCQVSYKAIKKYRDEKQRKRNMLPATEAPGPGDEAEPAYCYGQAPGLGQGDSHDDEPPIPWDPAECNSRGPRRQSSDALLKEGDREWIEDLQKATCARLTRDNRRVLEELQILGDKIDNMTVERLYTKLKRAMRLLLEYQQNPTFRTACETLQQAECTARELYTDETSVVLNLSALRIRIVITYLHGPKYSRGMDPTAGDKAADKHQCRLYIANSLKQPSLQDLARKFISSRYSLDESARMRAERDVMAAFDIALEVMASVHMLEPYNPSESPLPKDASDVVILALAEYCREKLGASGIYREVAKALREWRARPERQDRRALYCLYNSTSGEDWACNDGWHSVLSGDLSTVFGVTTEDGRVTKINLGCNNLDGKLPQEIEELQYLEELALPGNKLGGAVPKGLWDLPALRVVALQQNCYTILPPMRFAPANKQGPKDPAGSSFTPAFDESRRRRPSKGLKATVETCHPARLEVYKKEWFLCSWKITNTGGCDFSRDTKLVKVDEDGTIGGDKTVMINPLMPGEEHNVFVMQRAPDHETWLQETWTLAGESLDFQDDDDATTTSPLITVVDRRVSTRRLSLQEKNAPSLANDVFVAQRPPSHGSSLHYGSAGWCNNSR